MSPLFSEYRTLFFLGPATDTAAPCRRFFPSTEYKSESPVKSQGWRLKTCSKPRPSALPPYLYIPSTWAKAYTIRPSQYARLQILCRVSMISGRIFPVGLCLAFATGQPGCLVVDALTAVLTPFARPPNVALQPTASADEAPDIRRATLACGPL